MDARSSLLLSLGALAALSTSMRAQRAQPEERVGAFFEALAQERWSEAATLIHPARLKTFQDSEVSMLIALIRKHEALRKAGIRPRPGHEYEISYDPILRPEVLAAYAHAPISGVGGARTIGSASALPSAEFMAHWFGARGQLPDTSFRARFAHVPRRIIGGVIEADSVAHVLYRVNLADPRTRKPTSVEIMRLRKHEGQWYLWPDPNNVDFRTNAFVCIQLPLNKNGYLGLH